MDHAAAAVKAKTHSHPSSGAIASASTGAGAGAADAGDNNVNVNAIANAGSGTVSNVNSSTVSTPHYSSNATASTSGSTTLNSSSNLPPVSASNANSNPHANPLQQQTNRGKKFSWVKRLMNNNNAISAEPAPLTPTVVPHTNGNHHRQGKEHVQTGQQPHPRGHKKEHRVTNENVHPKAKLDKPETRGNVVLRKPLAQEQSNGGRPFQFNDVTSIENDEIVSYVSSNVSLRLQDSYDRQFYMRQDGYDANTIASVKSIFSGNPAPSIYSNGAVSVNSSSGGGGNRASFAPAPMSHINHLHPNTHGHSHSHGHSHTSATPNTHSSTTQLHPNNGTSYNNYLDSASTFSGSAAEDNVSTKPLVSFSSDEGEDDDEDDEDDNNDDDERGSARAPAHGNKHTQGHHVQIADDTLTGSNRNSEEYLATVLTATGDNDNDNDDNDVDGYIRVHGEGKDLDKRHDDFDESSFEVKSKYPSSTKSAAVTSMSVLTSPVLTTINSSTTTATTMTNNTTNTNVATAASVMTLASSSRHVYNV